MSTETTAGQSTGQIIELSSVNPEINQGLWHLALRRLRRDYLTIIAIVVVLALALLSLLAPVISKNILHVDYTRTSRTTYAGIDTEGHILGTDDIGRDYFARLLYGGRVSIGIAFTAAIFSLVIGVSVGLIAGFYHGGRLRFIDDFVMWFITTLNSIPTLYLLITLVAVLNGRSGSGGVGSSISLSVLSLILILGFLGWTGTTRLVRGEALSQREREYVMAARVMGANDLRIMFVHILPNVFSIIIVTLAIDIGALILVESTLSYLGLGVQEPVPSWGNMLTDAKSYYGKGNHLIGLPAVLVTVTVLCLYLIGDGLRDAIDPETVRR
ncbi:MAG TPA: ABC transporter permease [Aggregatilineales bacterium]|nr:ABC transporter permease [Aggregatilineales bacterium]